MRRAVLLVLVVLLAASAGVGCSSTAKETAAPHDPAREQPADARPSNLQNDAAHGRPPESKGEPAAAEAERSVALPDKLEVVAASALPDRPRVAVAFVRGGRLVRRADLLRRLAHDFEREARIEAIERLPEDAPSHLTLEQLCERAEKQGAHLLLVDARAADDAEKTTYVLEARAPFKALAFTRPRTSEPAGQELVARLVRGCR